MSIAFPPSVNLANLPTPVERLRTPPGYERLPNVYVKRDDLTGAALSGNKVRKLEFCLAEAAAAGADTVITCGGVQSNHARATAVAAARLGLRSILVLRGPEPAESDGNVLIDRLAGAEIRFIDETEWPRIGRIMAGIEAELEAAGRAGYTIPEGASYPPGVFGYIRAAGEIADAERALGLPFDAIVFAVGSGGTYAGLVYGARIFGLRARILGVNVLDTPEYFADRVAGISEDFVRTYERRYRGEPWFEPIPAGDVEIAGGYDGPAYAVPSEEGLELIRTFARATGLFLDPAYTGKAMLGLAGEAAKGRWKASDNVLFIHTGGIFSLFPRRKELVPPGTTRSE
ncbi:MAG: D-cysteine desulfhydrase family protein [Candidatus Latescibacterota bacterium]|jgi:D-cysteine desulfhydrase|nr:MAG: D-cysteine desulfhydrase family protein [Candidatus Latescibacterota bacterium]